MLAVRATGGSGALAYRWIKDGEPFSEDSHPDCIGVHSDTLQFLRLDVVHSGTYVCQVSDEKANCIIESKPAVLNGMFYRVSVEVTSFSVGVLSNHIEIFKDSLMFGVHCHIVDLIRDNIMHKN